MYRREIHDVDPTSSIITQLGVIQPAATPAPKDKRLFAVVHANAPGTPVKTIIGHGARKMFHSTLSPPVREIHLGVAAVLKDSRQIDDRSKGDLAHLRQGRGQSKTLNAVESFTASKCVEEHSHAINIRQTMDFLPDYWLVFLAYIAEVAMGVVLVTWLKKTLEFRRRFIRVQPSLRTSFDQDIPGPESWLIAQMAPALKELGFEIAANGHCPDIELGAAWTQVLFLNRAVGDRASLIVKRTGPSATATIAFATEAPGETQVTTSVYRKIFGYNAPPPDTSPTDVKALYVKHRQAVAERVFKTEQRVLPEIGKEHQWLHERAAKVAKAIAQKQGMVQIGEFYRLSWRSSAWHALKWMGQKFKLRRKAKS